MNKELYQTMFNAFRDASSLIENKIEVLDKSKDLARIVTKNDFQINKMICSYFQETEIPMIIYSEEFKQPIQTSDNPKYTIAIDPLDGSANMATWPKTLPYGTAITILKGAQPTFNDVIMSGFKMHANNSLWIAGKNEGTEYYTTEKLEIYAQKNNTNQLTDLKKEFLTIDNYVLKELLEINPNFLKLITDSSNNAKHNIRDFGSAAFHLAGVSSRKFGAYISGNQKHHELGMGYLMIKEAGGEVVNIKTGKDIGDQKYDFNSKTPIIAAKNKLILEKILDYA